MKNEKKSIDYKIIQYSLNDGNKNHLYHTNPLKHSWLMSTVLQNKYHYTITFLLVLSYRLYLLSVLRVGQSVF